MRTRPALRSMTLTATLFSSTSAEDCLITLKYQKPRLLCFRDAGDDPFERTDLGSPEKILEGLQDSQGQEREREHGRVRQEDSDAPRRAGRRPGKVPRPQSRLRLSVLFGQYAGREDGDHRVAELRGRVQVEVWLR